MMVNTTESLSEYERIFGQATARPTLYAPDDDEYLAIRQLILNTPFLPYDKNRLPFEGIDVVSVEKSESNPKADDATIVNDNISSIQYASIIEPIASAPSKSAVSEPQIKHHTFYIERQIIKDVICKAEGYYDEASNSFVLMQGSLLTPEIHDRLKFTSADYDRRKFISVHCSKNNEGYVVKKDTLCKSPAIAAMYATGILPVNGWKVWHDKEGCPLSDFYSS